jgi:hypothetical protein
MKILKFVLPSSRFLVNSLLVFSFVSVVAGAGSIAYQSKTVTTKTGSGVRISTYTPVPEATEPCTPEECEWWERVRQAGDDLQKKSNEKSKKGFYLLLYEGQQKAYRIPLKDRAPQLLVFGNPPTRPEIAVKNRITGTIEFLVEFKSDASVGDIQIIKGLGFGIDEKVIQAARQYVFLPAIQNGAFVAERRSVKTNFSDQWSKKTD